MAVFFWEGNGGNHGNTNWNNTLNWSPTTGPPGSGDNVTIEGYYGQGPGNPAIVDGTGAAYLMKLEGPVEFEGNFDVTAGSDATLSEGSVLSIDPGAQWQVTGDFNLLNTYNSGFGIDVDVGGAVAVSGTLSVSWANNIQVGQAGAFSVESIAPAASGAQGQASLTLGVMGMGLFADYGGFSVGGAVSIAASGNGAVLIDGPAVIDGAKIQAQDSGNVSLDSIASSNDTNFTVGSQNAWIAVGAGAASPGQFYLDGDLVTFGTITAPSILIGGVLEVPAGQSEMLTGPLSGAGNLKIDSLAALYVDDEPAASSTNTITFSAAPGYLALGDSVFAGTLDFLPAIKNFTAGDVIDLEGYTNAKIVEESPDAGGTGLLVVLSGQMNGAADQHVLDIQGPRQGQLQAVPESDSLGNDGTTIQYGGTGNEDDWSGNGATASWSDAGNWEDLTTGQPAAAAPGNEDYADFGELAGVSGGGAFVAGAGQAYEIKIAATVEFVDTADITAGQAEEFSAASTTIDAGAILTVSDFFTVQSNASLTIAGLMTVGTTLQQADDDNTTIDQSGTLDLTGDFDATLATDVSLAVDGTMAIGGQYLEGYNGTLTVAATASLTVSSDFVAASNGSTEGTFTIDGTMTIDGQLNQASDQAITISGGTLTVATFDRADNVTDDDYHLMSSGVFQDKGDFSASGGLFQLDSGEFSVAGTSTITGANIDLGSGGTFETGNGTISNNTIVDDGGGFFDVTSDLSSDGDQIGLLANGIFTVSGTATFTNDAIGLAGQAFFHTQGATFSGGTVKDLGTLLISGDMSSTGDEIEVTGTSSPALFAIDGTVTLTDDTGITIGNGDTFSAQDATLSGNTITANGSIGISGDLSSTGDSITVAGTSSPALLDVQGTVTLTNDTGFTIGDGATFSAADGTFSGDTITASGSIDISGDVSSEDDSIAVAGDNSAASFTVGGTVTLTNDTAFTIGDNATFNAQNATFSGDTIAASGSIDISDDLSSTGDTINVMGDSSGDTAGSFAVGGTATLSGDTMYVSNATVTLAAIGDATDQQDNNFQVNDSGSWIEIGGGGDAQGGDFIIDSGQTLSGGGEIAAFGIVIDGTLEVQAGDQEQFITALSGDGTVQIDSGATVQLDTAEASGDAAPAIDFDGSGGELTLWPEALSSNSVTSTIDGFGAGDKIGVDGVSDDSVTYAVDGDDNLVATIGGVDQLTFAGTALEDDLSVTPDNSGGAFVETLACFRAGTRLRTPGGEVAVERLRPGDRVVTISGKERPIQWIGRRTIKCRHHPDPRQVWPIRVTAGALGPSQPMRDLFLSPDHAVLAGGALIPIKYLANGTTIARSPFDEVTYYHVELDQHDIVLAEGLPCESYLDVGDRANFANGGDVTRLFPDFSSRPPSIAVAWETRGCAPLVVTGPRLAAARAMVSANATRVNWRGGTKHHQDGAMFRASPA